MSSPKRPKKTPEEIAEERIEVARRSKARELDLNRLGLTELPPSIGQLTQLQHLFVSQNQLTALPEVLGQLVQLQHLDVSMNQLTALPKALGQLGQLQRLDVDNNQLTALPEVLGQLGQLQRLDVHNNQLTALPEVLGQLTQLQQLDVSINQLTALPKALGQLSGLQSLAVTHNPLTILPDSLGQLTQLKELRACYNHLTTLPEVLRQLTQLEGLYAYNNQLTVLPDALGQLTQLQRLHVANNQLTALPESLRRLTNLEQLYLHENPALGLPPEVLGLTWQEIRGDVKPARPSDILDYYFQLRGGKRPLNEVRLLLVGRGAAGKTSIVRRLIENKFSARQKETKGIDIRPWKLQCGEDTVRAHVWDFAGQVITHATHQFFLTHRSVYVLVLTGREDSEKLDAEYWLRLIRAFGTERESGQTSPVIVALNKCETAPCKLDRNALQEKYPFIVDFVETDCHSGHGIRTLKELIRKTVGGMDSVREPFPQAWFQIKDQLATMKQDYVSYADFRGQCQKLGEADPGRQDSLAGVLHRLGVALNYSDDERLREATVLKPEWVTSGIYTLLRDAACEKGTMALKDVARVLPKEKPAMRRYLVELMRRFDLAFPLGEDGERWLVPQRLPPTQPKLGPEWQQPGLTRLRYQYTALPEGLVPRFVTRTYPLSEGQERWVNGVVLEMDEARALVRADPAERQVTVVVSGSADARRRLAGLIRDDLRRIHHDIRGLDPLEEMELEGKPGEWVRVQTLEADERKGQTSAAATREGTVTVDNTNELNRVSAPAARDPSQRKAKLFISYSSRDARQHDELTVRLKPLRSEGLVETWSDRCLVAGQEWDKTIRRELEEADVVVLLWSAHFEASDYIQGVEVQRALERAKAKEAVAVSIILEKCGWQKHPLAKYQVLPPKGRPVRDSKPIRDGWYVVQEGLRRVLEEVRARQPRGFAAAS